MPNPNQTFLRIEHKYLIDKNQMEQFLKLATDKIKPDIYPEYDLNNIYLDNSNYDIVRHCIEENGPYKEKLRIRSYGDPENDSPVFIEIKKKFKGLGEKRRVTINYQNLNTYLENPPKDTQINKELAYCLEKYKAIPKMFIHYHRLAFDGVKEPDLRITFDTDIRYRQINLSMKESKNDQEYNLNNKIILEIKLSTSYPLWLVEILNDINAQRQSFSKYGSIYQTNVLKQNKTLLQTAPMAVRNLQAIPIPA